MELSVLFLYYMKHIASWNKLFLNIVIIYLPPPTGMWAPERQRTYLSCPHVYLCIPSSYINTWHIEGFHKYLLNKQMKRSANSMKQYNYFFFFLSFFFFFFKKGLGPVVSGLKCFQTCSLEGFSKWKVEGFFFPSQMLQNSS